METKANEESKTFANLSPFFALYRSLIFIGHWFILTWPGGKAIK